MFELGYNDRINGIHRSGAIMAAMTDIEWADYINGSLAAKRYISIFGT